MMPRKLAIITVILLLWLVTSVITVRRSIIGSNDFDTYYNAGRAVIQSTSIYEFDRGRGEGSGPFLYSPFAAILFALISFPSLGLSAFLWNTLTLILFALSCYLARREINRIKSQLHELRQSRMTAVSFLFVLVIAVMLVDNLSMAQVNILVLYLVLISIGLLGRNKEFSSGLVLSVAILLKLTPLIFCLYYAMKKLWRGIGGLMLGLILFGVLLPYMTFGAGELRENYRVWAQRLFKPIWASQVMAQSNRLPDILHPDPEHLYQPEEVLLKSRLETLLTVKNQSLGATLSRWLLKDRNLYAQNEYYPIYLARRYEKMPVIGGGVSPRLLFSINLILQLLIIGFIVWCLIPKSNKDNSLKAVLDYSLLFLTMTLIAPSVRSHQFIYWLLPILFLFLTDRMQGNLILTPFVRVCAVLGCLCYLLQAIPYGKAAGMGTMANLMLWIGFARIIIHMKRASLPFDAEPSPQPFAR